MNWFTYTLKKSPLFRVVVFLSFAVLVVFLLRFAFGFFSKKPVVTSILPTVVSENETVTIVGENFGLPDSAKGLRFGNEFFPSTQCIMWTDTKITFKVPKNFKTNLIKVSNANLNSQETILTNKAELPQILQKQLLTSLPEIMSISKDSGVIGEKITIKGKNFGTTRQNSTVVFTPLGENFLPERVNEIEGAFCSEANFDFVSWTDNEIVVCVPETASTGGVLVATEAGLSNLLPFTVSNRVGKKELLNKRTILISLAANAQDFKVRSSENTLFLILPQPIQTYAQKNIILQATEPQAFAKNFQGSNIYRFESLNETSKIVISENLSVETYDVNVSVNVNNVSANINLKPEILEYTKSENLVPAYFPEIKSLASKITANSKNPYNNAKKIFNYLVENFAPVKRPINSNIDLIECINKKQADAYELSLLFCALMRYVGVPCVQVSGVAFDISQNTHAHWWNEFYIEGIGWIPVDTALAVGLPFNTGKKANEFFAKIDGLRIAFSRDFQAQTQMLSESSIVSKTKTYANRKIWEESSGLAAYNSFWALPKVVAIY
ncbi:MAG: transglutaminase domain-containing protein [Treponemataceae bacterium]